MEQMSVSVECNSEAVREDERDDNEDDELDVVLQQR